MRVPLSALFMLATIVAAYAQWGPPSFPKKSFRRLSGSDEDCEVSKVFLERQRINSELNFKFVFFSNDRTRNLKKIIFTQAPNRDTFDEYWRNLQVYKNAILEVVKVYANPSGSHSKCFVLFSLNLSRVS
jgi:hypothetical protein